MLTPEQIEKLPEELVTHFLKLEEQIIFELSERIAADLRLTETDDWKIDKLLEVGYKVEDIEKAIEDNIQYAIEETENILRNAADTSYKNDIDLYKLGKKDLMPLQDNKKVQRFIDAAIKQTKGDLSNLTNTTGFAVGKQFKSVRKLYTDALTFGVLQISSGAYDYQTAIRKAVKTVGDSGLRAIDYETGRRYGIESQIRTAILTGTNQITGLMSEANADLMGQDLMEVTAHAGARPSHADWQGEVVSRSGDNPNYLSAADIGYGDAGGFKGANCRHDWFPYFEGISEKNYTDEMLEQIDPDDFEYEGKTYTAYEATQQQRYIERQMRKSKRRLIAYDAAKDETAFTTESIRLRRWRDEYSKFSKAAGLRPKHDRHQTYNYDRSIAAKARWRY